MNKEVKQIHHGVGDNVNGDKIMYNNFKNEEKEASNWKWLIAAVVVPILVVLIPILIKKNNMNNINQNHYGTGDNVAGDKIINIESPSFGDLPGITLRDKARSFVSMIGPNVLEELDNKGIAYIDLTPAGVRMITPVEQLLINESILRVENRNRLQIEPGKDQLSGYTLHALENF